MSFKIYFLNTPAEIIYIVLANLKENIIIITAFHRFWSVENTTGSHRNHVLLMDAYNRNEYN